MAVLGVGPALAVEAVEGKVEDSFVQLVGDGEQRNSGEAQPTRRAVPDAQPRPGGRTRAPLHELDLLIATDAKVPAAPKQAGRKWPNGPVAQLERCPSESGQVDETPRKGNRGLLRFP